METNTKEMLTQEQVNKIRKDCVVFIKQAMTLDVFHNNNIDTDVEKQFKVAMLNNIVGAIDSMCAEKKLTYSDLDIDATVDHFAEIEQKVQDVLYTNIKSESECWMLKPSLKLAN